ncbi:MAG: hypothetical protein IPP19_10145 [Verrucomicrobia bacterium]|nr:hypothetical protein [Verrucomicrobiota bacterium]
MKRIEVRLSLEVVAPLLDVVKEVSDALQGKLAAPLDIGEVDADMREFWRDELVAAQNGDIAKLLALFDKEFFSNGVIVFDADNAEPVMRACSAVRLRMREENLKGIEDETLETGNVEIDQLTEQVRRYFMCYLFLATLQELIIQHLDTLGDEEDGEGI